jgi:hypothetical protein
MRSSNCNEARGRQRLFGASGGYSILREEIATRWANRYCPEQYLLGACLLGDAGRDVHLLGRALNWRQSASRF